MQLGILFGPPRPELDPGSLCDGDERAVLAALEWGKGNARKIDDLAAITGIPSRRVQEIIRHLIIRHQVPVGTSMGEPFGNYLMDSIEEVEGTERLLRARALNILYRCASLKRMTRKRYIELVQTDFLDGGDC